MKGPCQTNIIFPPCFPQLCYHLHRRSISDKQQVKNKDFKQQQWNLIYKNGRKTSRMNCNRGNFTESSLKLLNQLMLQQIINPNILLCCNKDNRTSRMKNWWYWKSMQLKWKSLCEFLGQLVYKNCSWFTY